MPSILSLSSFVRTSEPEVITKVFITSLKRLIPASQWELDEPSGKYSKMGDDPLIWDYIGELNRKVTMRGDDIDIVFEGRELLGKCSKPPSIILLTDGSTHELIGWERGLDLIGGSARKEACHIKLKRASEKRRYISDELCKQITSSCN